MCYDSSNKKAVLFGGWDQSAGLNDLWIYDYSLNEWKDITPPVSPPGRLDHTLCYDSAEDLVILFGGWTNNNASYGYSSDTWALSVK